MGYAIRGVLACDHIGFVNTVLVRPVVYISHTYISRYARYIRAYVSRQVVRWETERERENEKGRKRKGESRRQDRYLVQANDIRLSNHRSLYLRDEFSCFENIYVLLIRRQDYIIVRRTSNALYISSNFPCIFTVCDTIFAFYISRDIYLVRRLKRTKILL